MKIEGILDWWDQERVGQIHPGEYWVNDHGQPERWGANQPSISKNYVIIRKIEKPKQFRPFENAAEFEPHKKRWLTHPENTVIGEFQVVEFNDNGIWCRGMDDLMPYKHAYEVGLRFDDGTPFGIEVTE